MKVSILLGAAIATQSVAATFWFDYNAPYELPYKKLDECNPEQSTGVDFEGYKDGIVDRIADLSCTKWEIKKSKLGKRNGRGSNKCASTYIEPETYSNEIKGDKKFTIDEYDVSIDDEEETTVEFNYGMPDGSSCKQVSKCGKGINTIKNTQCGGAKSMKCRIHKSSKNKKKKCGLNVHHIKFKCKNKPDTPAPCQPGEYGCPAPSEPAPSCQPGEYGCPATTEPGTTAPTCVPGEYGCPATEPATTAPTCVPGEYGCPATTEPAPTTAPSCVPGEYGCPATTEPAPTTAPSCQPGEYGCPATTEPAPSCQPGEYGCPESAPTTAPTSAPSCVPGEYGCPATTEPVPTEPVPSCQPGEYGCPETAPTTAPTTVPASTEPGPDCVPGEYGCPETAPTTAPTTAPSCVPGEYGCPATTEPAPTTAPSCVPGEYGCPESAPTTAPTTAPATTEPGPDCVPGEYGCPETAPTTAPAPTEPGPDCVPGEYGCPETAPTTAPTSALPTDSCLPGEYGCPVPTDDLYVPPVNTTAPAGPTSDSPVTDVPTGTTTDYVPLPSVPVETGCPPVLPQCMKAWTSITQCIDSGDVNCLCPNAEYITNVAGCVEAYGIDDDEVSKALEYLQGLCAEKIPENPAIVTCVPDYVTLPPVTSGASTITVSTTVVVPCTSCAAPAETTAPGYTPVYVTETVATTVTVCPVKLITTEPSKPVLVPGTVTAPPYVPPSSVPATVPAEPTYVPPYVPPTTMNTVYPTAPASNTTVVSPPVATGAASSLKVTGFMAGLIGVVAFVMA